MCPFLHHRPKIPAKKGKISKKAEMQKKSTKWTFDFKIHAKKAEMHKQSENASSI